MLRPAAVIALALLAAACGREEGQGDAAGTPPAADAVSAAETPAAVAAAPPGQAVTTVGPSGFVGRWAAQPNLCAAGAWTFAADRLTTAGEVSCTFGKVERTQAGWEIAARCTAEGPPQDAGLTLTLTDPAPPETMTVAGGPFESVTLRRCP
ncbi:MAG TPA: hypothetical protein VF699_09215 [Caulobacteraceae bacterium]|jgi:hypothetical protein